MWTCRICNTPDHYTYGELRGDFRWSHYNEAGEGQNNFRGDVIAIGHEIVLAEYDGPNFGYGSGDKKAQLSVQSMPDLAFIISHGGWQYTSRPASVPPHDPNLAGDGYMPFLSSWPKHPNDNGAGSDTITCFEIMDACPVDSDTEWLAIIACNALQVDNNYSLQRQIGRNGYDDWENIIHSGQSSINAVVGFSHKTNAWYPGWNTIGDTLTDNLIGSTYQNDMWDPALAPEDRPEEWIVTAWMETAFERMEYENFRQYAVGIDETGVWVINDVGANNLTDYRITRYVP